MEQIPGESKIGDFQEPGTKFDARGLAQILAVAPDCVNLELHVGFNTQFVVDEILRLRAENANLKSENRKLKARLGELADGEEDSSDQTQKLSSKELLATLRAAENRLKELELDNAKTRMQMIYMPERSHNAGHSGRPW